MAGALLCRRLLALLLLGGAVLFEVQPGRAAPLQPPPQQQLQGEAALLSKIYPRGSHWAVGHLMGKKSTDELPDVYEGADTIPSSKFPENFKQLEGFVQSKTADYLLQIMNRKESTPS
ncbi:gastrin-releasing peptide isoform X2 [Rhinatrema bivittatum]|uniref:gastrin-releasing peptide isoform X2 n=1 Tax=Rhinatrema bivittatum TaxID=194408 RepID=UPI00112B28DC|nr:gastrin-releasing peptide isoform X2 [Rhinatrema bivittatum]